MEIKCFQRDQACSGTSFKDIILLQVSFPSSKRRLRWDSNLTQEFILALLGLTQAPLSSLLKMSLTLGELWQIKPVSSKGNQHWILTGRTDAEAPILWPPDVKSQLIRKASDAGKDWRQEEKGTTEDEIVGWHHLLEFEHALGPCDGQGSLACCSLWGRKVSAGLSNWSELFSLFKKSVSWKKIKGRDLG